MRLLGHGYQGAPDRFLEGQPSRQLSYKPDHHALGRSRKLPRFFNVEVRVQRIF